MASFIPAAGRYGIYVTANLQDTPVYLMLVCNTDLTISRSRDVIDANSKCGPNQIPAKTVTVEITGTVQVKFSSDGNETFDGQASEMLLDKLWKQGISFNWKIAPIPDENNPNPLPGELIYEGEGFFSSLDTNYPTDDVPTSDFTLSVQGDYTTTATPATT